MIDELKKMIQVAVWATLPPVFWVVRGVNEDDFRYETAVLAIEPTLALAKAYCKQRFGSPVRFERLKPGKKKLQVHNLPQAGYYSDWWHEVWLEETTYEELAAELQKALESPRYPISRA
ncbi:MAG TPA: hypothetical protein VEA59_00940 [Patescibacteria group bacterium]|nr:hypothetical protein [Patescibacteria group bacterium]